MRRTETADEKQERLYRRHASGTLAVEEYRADERRLRELTVRARRPLAATRDEQGPGPSAGARGRPRRPPPAQ
jgi:hypothetical protein